MKIIVTILIVLSLVAMCIGMANSQPLGWVGLLVFSSLIMGGTVTFCIIETVGQKAYNQFRQLNDKLELDKTELIDDTTE